MTTRIDAFRVAKQARPRRERRNVRPAPFESQRRLSLQTHHQTAALRNLHPPHLRSFSDFRVA